MSNNIETTKLVFLNEFIYVWEDDTSMRREYGLTPEGNEIDGRWVLRDRYGHWIDVDKYRYDIAPRHNKEI